MARNLYSAYRAAGSSSGKYKASLFDVESKSEKMAFADKRGAWEQEKLTRNVETIGAGLELASTIAGGLQSQQEAAGDITKAFPGAEQTYGEAKWGDIFRSDVSAGRTTGETRWGELGEKLSVSLGGKERKWEVGEGLKGIEAGEYKQSDILASAKVSTYEKLGLDAAGQSTSKRKASRSRKKTMAEETGITPDKNKFQKAEEKGYDTSAAADLLEQGKVKEDLPKDFIGPPAPEQTLASSESAGENLLEAVPEYKQGKGLTAQANTKLYEADPSMEGKSPEERIKRYEELFGGMKFTP